MTGSPNQLFLADNLPLLRARRRAWSGRFRCAYLDPPFNTGRTFDEYDDDVDPRAWAERMRAVASAVHPLLAPEGALFAEIDDTELGALLGVLDEVFGRANRIAVVTVVRSAATGHKARNRGPVNVTDFLLLYAKERARFAPSPLVRPRPGHDPAYRTYLARPDAPDAEWTFEPLGRVVAEHLGHASAQAARKALGAPVFEMELERFALAHARHVIRFAQPRYEAIARAAQALVDRSKKEPSRVLRLARRGHPDFVVRGGNRVLFLADKVRDVDGEPRMVEPLTNVWDDIGFQGIAREGGVTFVRNKKPERLLERVLRMSTAPGDWVLDPFAGTGTTAAVAHKMGRRWVAIEREPELLARARGRLERVVRGEDATGVTRSCGWRGGGSFEVVPAERNAKG